MSVIPCEQNAGLRDQIEKFAEVLKTQAHLLGKHGLDEKEFYNSGLFRGAVERIRGQYSATMRPKREFVQHVLNHMEDSGLIEGWDLSEAAERSDYWVRLTHGRNAVIALTGGMDGNNVTLFERPGSADEFIIWSIMTNAAGDPRRNAWSGIHTRLSAEMIARDQQVDGVIIWDMVCGTVGRPCPKIMGEDGPRLTDLGPFRVPPPCVYMFPAIVPAGAVTKAIAQQLADVTLLQAFHTCFGGRDDEVNFVDFEIQLTGSETWRKTTVTRADIVQVESEMTPIRRG
ncbi:hypothetical protein SAMN05216548_104273 [Faunimonas pinastri]|uniref:Uncharacterized protein n=1 Tax=Faunimonas pinastri TaxID=1855383 RepID=A0A1H9G154_9HYPH|nr:hypothetical protein [Faunimonas pinastri]SEQ43824.1 hypothetical protein SAMN05216548_104273 [Faunimonas pinastri]